MCFVAPIMEWIKCQRSDIIVQNWNNNYCNYRMCTFFKLPYIKWLLHFKMLQKRMYIISFTQSVLFTFSKNGLKASQPGCLHRTGTVYWLVT